MTTDRSAAIARFVELTTCPACGEATSFSFNESLGHQAHWVKKYYPAKDFMDLIFPCCGHRSTLSAVDLETIRTVWWKEPEW